jgi:hypothetical protein
MVGWFRLMGPTFMFGPFQPVSRPLDRGSYWLAPDRYVRIGFLTTNFLGQFSRAET